MKLLSEEKKVLNRLFKGVKGTTRNTMLIALYASKPADDGSPDAKALIRVLNELILKLSQASPEEMALVFKGIPYLIKD